LIRIVVRIGGAPPLRLRKTSLAQAGPVACRATERSEGEPHRHVQGSAELVVQGLTVKAVDGHRATRASDPLRAVEQRLVVVGRHRRRVELVAVVGLCAS